jgi:hypothetical protein
MLPLESTLESEMVKENNSYMCDDDESGRGCGGGV